MAEIKVLSENIRNKIAAGEVLERPASAVKELVENSVDAGAENIEIEIADGGQSYIRVTDDGAGISQNELSMAVMRHATSKINDIDDIYKICSMGFRGEALPSIASVSRFEISSRRKDEDSAHSIIIEGGEIKSEQPCSKSFGTVVTIKDLFFNTPARRKFLKSSSSEVSAIRETITKIALAYPEIAFRFINNEKEVYNLKSQNFVLDRIGDLFGEKLLGSFLDISCDIESDIKLSGFAAMPPESNSNSKMIYTFVNRRCINHSSMLQSIRRAYEGLLAPRRYPIAFLYLAIDPGVIDINVHPTKNDIRFSDERKINGIVYRGISQAIRSGSMAMEEKDNRDSSGDNVSLISVQQNENTSCSDIAGENNKGNIVSENIVDSKAPGVSDNVFSKDVEISKDVDSSYTPAIKNMFEAKPKSEQLFSPTSKLQGFTDLKKNNFRIIGTLHASFIIVEAEEGIVFVDQHALHERIIYEELLKQKSDITVQRLLVPAVLELSEAEFQMVEDNMADLADMGFELEEFGGKTILIHAIPQLIKNRKAAELLKDCIYEISRGQSNNINFKEPFLRTIACKAAVKAGESLPDEMIISLLEDLKEKNLPFTCPHGRPFAFEISSADIRRRFERT